MEKLKVSNYLQVLKFLIAGAIGASIEISLFVFLHEIQQMHYLVANLIAICVAIFAIIISLKDGFLKMADIVRKLNFMSLY